jgi:phosphoglycolate phosphatase-like HAD superfamily hydrolase
VLESDDKVAEMTSSADVGTAKPAPDIIEVALAKAGVPPERALMIGDSVWDVKAAKRAGVQCIGVLSGGVSRGELMDAGAIAVYADTAELLAGLDESPIAALRA